MATFTVLNTGDSGPGSLRWAIDQANTTAGADVIEFQSDVTGIITLTAGELLVSDDLTITGLGSAAISVFGNNASRIFNIQGVSSLNVTISGLTLSGGKVTGADGGAILNNNSSLTLYDLIISNSKADNGAGIYNNDGTVTLLNSMVKNNIATGNGGGVYSTASGTVMLDSSTLYTNSAADGAGLYTAGDANIANSLLSGNTASGKGAGIDNQGTLTLNNSTLYSNTATGNGGAIYNADTGVASLSADTITANSAASGDGIYNDTNAGTNGVLKIRDTILSGNNSDDLQNNGSLVIGGAEGWGTFNLIGTATGATGLDAANNNITGVNDPKLGPLQPDGAMTPNADSAAINAGVYIPGLSTDVVGNSRAEEERVDIGATETNTAGAGPTINPPATGNTILVTTASDIVDPDDGFMSLREAIIQANSSNNDTITFKDTLAGSTIQLTSNMVAINKNVTITGLGKDNLTISGGWSGSDATDGYRIFNTGDNTSTVLNVTISGMTLTNGYSSTNGGAILNRGENLTLIDTVITGSKAESSEVDEGGGGIFNQGGSVSLLNSFVTGNTAAFGGGIANSANGTLNVTNSLIADNRAGFGGGVYNWDGSVTLTNATIAGNAVSSADGGGVTNDSGTLSIYNSIIALNYNDLGTNKDTSGIISGDSNHNLIGATYLTDGVNGNIIGADPLFFSNPDAGFDGVWGTADDITGDYHLTDGSPAIDAGNNAALPTDIHDLDQDGNTSEPLPVDLDGSNRTNDSIVDIGAYESIPPDVTPPTVPDGLTQTVTGGHVTFDWTDATDLNGVSGYTVEVSSKSDFSIIDSTLNSATSDTATDFVTDGAYYWRVSAQDSSDNSSGWSVFSSFSIDLTPPSVPVGLTATLDAGTVAFNWDDASDNTGGSGVSLYEFQEDNDGDFSSPENTFTSSSSDATLNGLAEGSYFWRVRTQDNAGNWSAWSAVDNFDVDLTPPSIPDGLTQIDNGGGDISFDWNDSADLSGVAQYEIRVDNNNDFSSPENTATSATSDVNVTGLTDGSYFWQVRAQDNAGNWSAWSASGSFSIDLLAPSVPDGLQDTVNISSVAFDWNDSTDNASGVKQYEVMVDNNDDFSSPENTITSLTSDAALTGMAEGSYFWRVRTQDNNGNWSAWSATDSFAIDLTPPSIPDGLTKTLNGGGSVSFDWNDSADSSGIAQYEVQVDNSSNFGSPEKIATSATSDVTIAGIAEGSYFWRVRSQDNAGNWSAWSAADSFDLDATAPAVPNSLTQVVTGGNNVAFDWADSADAKTGLKQYEMQVDNNNDFSSPENILNPATSDASLSGVADGSYFWRVRALDNAGNWSAWSTSASFSVDITAPSIPSGLTQTTNLGNVALDWADSSDNVSGVKQYEVQADNNNDFSSLVSNATSAASNANLSDLADGSYFWRVRTQDNFGNWSSWSAANSFDIDLVPPTIPLNLTQNVTGTDVSMNWDDATDTKSGVKQYQVQVDNNSNFSSPEKTGASLTSDFAATGLAEGGYFWRVRTQDNNGNWSTWSTVNNFIVDIAAPSVPSGMIRTVTGSNVALNWDDASDALAGVKLYQIQLDNNANFSTPEYSASPAASAANFNSVADGNYFWRVRTQDNSGNWSNWSAADSLTVDTTGPAVPVNLTKKLNGHSVDLDWNDTTDALSGLKQYEVQVDTHEDFSNPLNAITTSASAATVDRLVDGKYFWRVRAQDNFGNWSSWSAKSTFSVYFPDFTPPTVPVGLTKTMRANSLSLNWVASTDESGIKRYQVQVDKNKDFSKPVVSTLSETNSAMVSGLSEGTYNWRVRAQDNAGNWSNWSAASEFKASFDLLPPSVPVGLKQTIVAGSASLDWEDSKDARSGVSGYEIQIDNNADFSSPEKTTTAAISKATVSGLTEGSYFWRVRAQDGAGHMSSWSKASTLLIPPADTAANDWKNARNITDGIDHWVGVGDAADCYKLIMSNAGTLTLGLGGLTGNANLSLLDSKGRVLKTSANRGTTGEAITDFALLSGTYYVKVAPADARTSSKYILTNTVKYTPVDKAANTWQAAKNIADGVDNWAGFGDAADFYKVSMTTAGTLTLKLTGLTGDANLSLLDSNGRVLKTSANRANKDEAIAANLFSGTYYVKVAPVTGVNNAPYTLTSVKKDSPADTAGNSFETALKVTTGGTTAEWLGFSDKADFYKFDLLSATSAQFNLTGLKSNVNLYLYDGKKRQIAVSAKPGSNNEAITKTLAAGTYYVAAKLVSGDNTDYSLAFNIDQAPFKAGSLKMFGASSPLTSGSDSALSSDPLKKNQGMLAS